MGDFSFFLELWMVAEKSSEQSLKGAMYPDVFFWTWHVGIERSTEGEPLCGVGLSGSQCRWICRKELCGVSFILRSIHTIICIFCMYVMYVCMYGWMDGCMYVRMYVRTYGWMDGCMDVCMYIYIYINTCIYHTYIQQQYMQYPCFYNIYVYIYIYMW